MATIREMENRVLNARDSIEMIMLRIMDEYKQRILDLNREKQLFEQGVTTEGEVVGFYKRSTIEQFGKNASIGDPYNFEDTGDMFKGFNLEFYDGHLRLFSTDWKADMWEAKIKEKGLSGTLQGLTKENELILNYDFIKPELLSDLKRLIYG